MDLTTPYPSPAIIGRNCEMTSPNIRKPEKDSTFLIFIVVAGILKTNRKSICSAQISEKLLAAMF